MIFELSETIMRAESDIAEPNYESATKHKITLQLIDDKCMRYMLESISHTQVSLHIDQLYYNIQASHKHMNKQTHTYRVTYFNGNSYISSKLDTSYKNMSDKSFEIPNETYNSTIGLTLW